MARPRDRRRGPPGPGDPPEYTRYRASRRILPRRSEDSIGLTRSGAGAPPGKRRRPTARKVVKWVLLALAGWILLSVVVFLISAQIQTGKVADDAKRALDGGGYPLTSANTILVLGSDLRTA